MIGDVRNLDEPSALAAALDRAAWAAKGLVRGALAALRHAAQGLDLLRKAPPDIPFGATVIPTVRYRDVPAAVRWLCRAFGMKVHRIVPDANGAPRYAELTVGSGMLMVAPIEDTAFGRLMVQPDEIGGVETQVCYLYVRNARKHFARAKAAGAAIVLDLEDETNMGRGYSCRDPEGHVWNFGTYDPWRRQPPPPRSEAWSLGAIPRGVAALSLLALAAVLLIEAVPQPSARAGTAVTDPQAREPLTGYEARQEPEQAAVKALADSEAQRRNAALEAAERTALEARAQLAEARGALARAEREAAVARSQLEELQRAKLAAERAAAEARVHLAAAQKDAERARTEAEIERDRRLAASRTAARAVRRAALRPVRVRSRVWCYTPYEPIPASSAGSRLSGFCKI